MGRSLQQPDRATHQQPKEKATILLHERATSVPHGTAIVELLMKQRKWR
jgi:hypothetical protein